MDPTTPAPDDPERPEDVEADAAPPDEGARARRAIPEAGPAGAAGATDADAAAAEDRAADDGWGAEVEPIDAAGGQPAGAPTSPGPAAARGTEHWRGPEASGWDPASDSAPVVEPGAPIADDASPPSEALRSAPEVTSPVLEPGGPAASTDTWRGPEPTGWTPGPVLTHGSAVTHSPEVERPGSAPATEAPSTSPGTGGWRGPESTGWTPDDHGLASPASYAAHEAGPEASPAGMPRPDEIDRPAGGAEGSSDTARLEGHAPDGSDLEAPADAVDDDLRVEAAAETRRTPGFSFFGRAKSDEAQTGGEADLEAAYPVSEHLRVEERPRRVAGRRTAAAAPMLRADPAEICPFLVAAAGGWRLAVPSREHRCAAVTPPSPLSPQKQTRLCLTEGHLRCATFLAAGAAREARVGSAAMPDRVSRWALARTTPVVEEAGGVRTTLAGMLADRRRWPAIPAMLLVVALATLGLSSLRGGGPVTALASPTPLPTEAAVATASLAPTPTLAPTPEPSPTVAPTVAPTTPPTPAPSHATYTVKSGDTLSQIAKQFGTTVQALVDLNGIKDPASLKIGQVLQIP